MSFTYIDNNEYKRIKTLLGADLNKSLVAKVSKRSWKTVDWISKSTDINDYKELVRNYGKEQEASKKQKTQPKVDDKAKAEAIVAAFDNEHKVKDNPLREVTFSKEDRARLERIEQRLVDLNDRFSKEAEVRKIPFWK